eukprot:scaffold1808_cov360-Prasinococcus_capsulatus_cf.AAC.23
MARRRKVAALELSASKRGVLATSIASRMATTGLVSTARCSHCACLSHTLPRRKASRSRGDVRGRAVKHRGALLGLVVRLLARGQLLHAIHRVAKVDELPARRDASL